MALNLGASETIANLVGLLSGTAVATVVGLGTNALDKRFNLSGFYRPQGGITGKGAFNGEAGDGEGFGTLANKEIDITREGLDVVKNHIDSNDFSCPENDAMIQRLEIALANGETLSGADASFYTHEMYEANLMAQGMPYEEAHLAALQAYGVSPFSVYHPDVISAYPDFFNNEWFNFWNL